MHVIIIGYLLSQMNNSKVKLLSFGCSYVLAFFDASVFILLKGRKVMECPDVVSVYIRRFGCG